MTLVNLDNTTAKQTPMITNSSNKATSYFTMIEPKQRQIQTSYYVLRMYECEQSDRKEKMRKEMIWIRSQAKTRLLHI